MKYKKILCEISGGADSMLATLLAIEKYVDYNIYGIIYSYGQAPYSNEYKCATKFCLKNNIILKEVKIDNLFISGTVIGEHIRENKKEVADIYTPLRNLVFLSCSASYAESIGAESIIVGSKSLNFSSFDPYSFKDSTLPFYRIFEGLLNYVSYKKIRVEPILMENRISKMTKKEVIQELYKRNYSVDDFYNCFNKNKKPNCQCNNCIEMRKILGEVIL